MKKLTIANVFVPKRIEEALTHLSTNKDTCGMDGVHLSDLKDDWEINREHYLSLLQSGRYTPGTVQIYEIVNYMGKRRAISSFNSVDRLILRCIATSLEECYAGYLSQGLDHVAVIDIKHYFDSIPIDRLEMILKRLIDDKILLSLFHKFLYCKISEDNVIKTKSKGILQGSPISPFLGNLYLALLDTQLESLNIHFCRYCDDISMFL